LCAFWLGAVISRFSSQILIRMMTINLRIKANVDNLTLAEIYELLAKYSRETKNKDNFYEFKGYIFKIEAETNMSIDYVITEIV
jgi:hypothetical protein